MAAKTPVTPEEQDKAYNPGELHAAEQFNGGYYKHTSGTFDNVVGHTKSDHDGETVSPTKNTEEVNQKESQPSINRGWVNNFTGKNDGKKRFSSKKISIKKGPTGLIIGIATAGGVGLGGILSPGAALVHIKEVVVGKLDTLTSVNTARADIGLKKRMFATSTTCKIKVRCRFNGLTQTQMDRLNEQGAQLLDKDGKPVKARKIAGLPGTTRYVGGQTLVFPDADGKTVHKVTAGSYKKALRTNPALRALSKKVHAPKYTGLAGKVMKKVRAKFKLTTDQKWGAEGDEKEARKSIYQTQSGEGASGNVDVQDDAQYETDKDGNKVPKDKDSTHINFGDLGPSISELEAEDAKKAAAGEVLDPLPTDPAAVAMMDDPDVKTTVKGGLNKALGFLNPIGIVSGMCTIYQLSYAMVLAAKTIAMTQAMRYASSFLSTLDKIKYGDATSDEITKMMTILQREDQFGNNFGDAVGYQYPAYGTVSDSPPIASSATGNATIRTLTAALDWINDHVGGAHFVRTTCKVLTNPLVQGGLGLLSFIPGVGAAASTITKVVSTGGKEIAEKGIKDVVQNIIKKQVEKAGKASIKDAAKTASKKIFSMAKGPLGLFVASYLTGKYAIPWAARQLSNTALTGSEDGVTAMDTISNGFDATNDAAAQEGGMAPLTQEDYKQAFKPFNDNFRATYVADERAASNPLDLNNPYSAANSFAASFYTFSSKFTLQNGTSSLLSIPATILSSLNPGRLLSQNASADIEADADSCDSDSYIADHDLAASPFCNVKRGFADTNMLENEDPDAIIDWMYNKKQIDDDGEPVTDSDYAKFREKCVDNSSGKIIGDVGLPEEQLDPECFSDKNDTTDWKMYRLYIIDSYEADNMDQPLGNDDSEDTKTPETNADPNLNAYIPNSDANATTVSTTQPVNMPVTACAPAQPSTSLSRFAVYAPITVTTDNITKTWEPSYAA